jgi:hypothetical protein
VVSSNDFAEDLAFRFPITDGNAMVAMLRRFSFWQLTRETSGRVKLVVRAPNSRYIKLSGRKGETECQIVERLRQEIVA